MSIFSPSQKQTAVAHLTALLDKGKRVRVEAVAEIRTMPQNRVMWLWLTCISQITGNDKNDLHDYFREKYLEPVTVQIFGNKCEKLKSTTELNTAQFTEYLEKIRIFAQIELGIELPNPKDKDFEHFVEHYKNYI